jgi:hypothetical protein
MLLKTAFGKYKSGKRFASNKPSFNFEDPLNYRSLLNEEELEIQSNVRKYCTDKLMPRVTNAFRKENFDREIMREMGELGILGSNHHSITTSYLFRCYNKRIWLQWCVQRFLWFNCTRSRKS